jgi:hypothetical protein
MQIKIPAVITETLIVWSNERMNAYCMQVKLMYTADVAT